MRNLNVMRHGKKFNHLSRTSSHRKAMLANMACSLIEHKRINTTVAKAKALRVYAEPLFTKSKVDSTHSRRTVFSYLQNKKAVSELFRVIAPKISDRPGGYTRIIRTGYRLGDNAEMCIIELVDFNELYSNTKTKKNTRRSRRKTSSESNKIDISEDISQTEENVSDAPSTKEEDVSDIPSAKEENVSDAPSAKEEDVSDTPSAKEENVSDAPSAKEEDVSDTPSAKEEDALDSKEKKEGEK